MKNTKTLKELESEDRLRKEKEDEMRGGPKAAASRKKLKELHKQHKKRLKELNIEDKERLDNRKSP